MRKDLTSQQQLLADFMSDISERCYDAGWMHGLEYVLWDALLNGQRKYGHDTISQQDIETLGDLSKTANAWIVFDDATEETAMELDKWNQKFQQDIERNPELLKG
jgi:hypothetical protein